VNGTRVSHVDDLASVVERESIELGVVATPASAASDVVQRLARCGVHSILNFAPAVVNAPDDVLVHHVDLAAELQVLTFYLARHGARAPLPANGGGEAAERSGEREE